MWARRRAETRLGGGARIPVGPSPWYYATQLPKIFQVDAVVPWSWAKSEPRIGVYLLRIKY
jgi:hypothetical protein